MKLFRQEVKAATCAHILCAGIAVLALSAGCSSVNFESKQAELAQLYYQNDLSGAAELAGKMSDDFGDVDNDEALLWHLEAGNVYLDLGDYRESMRALNRAEKLLYLYDGYGHPILQHPGQALYSGYRSDRLLLHLLKGFNYLSQGKVEDFLVEIRRLRAEQFSYILNFADPEIRIYEKQNSGKENIAPLAMKRILSDSSRAPIFKAAKLDEAYIEYSQRRRPQLPLYYNPLVFYLSVLGYTFDREYEEAKIDLEYLLQLDPENRIYRNDAAKVVLALGDQLSLSAEERGELIPLPDDQVLCVIVGRGKPDGWGERATDFELSGQVPTDWTFSYPQYQAFTDPGFEVINVEGKSFRGEKLADLSQIINEEYWQWMFPKMVDSAYRATVAMTVAHTTALASLAAAQAIQDEGIRAIAVASAAVAVAATERAYVKDTEWRRWITLPRSYSLTHLPLPADPAARKFTLKLDLGQEVKEETITIAPDTNRAVVYVRILDDGKYILKCWESME